MQGLYGIAVQSQGLGSPIAGFFGFSVQLGVNFGITGYDEKGSEINQCYLEISYTNNSVLTKETMLYDPRILYQRSLPIGVPIQVRVYGPGYVPYSTSFTLANGEYKTLAIVLQFGYAISKRYKSKAPTV